MIGRSKMNESLPDMTTNGMLLDVSVSPWGKMIQQHLILIIRLHITL